MWTHYFFSESGDVLPRWQEAFPAALAARFDVPVAGTSASNALFWVRLPADVPVVEAIDRARGTLGDVPIIALSDRPGDEEALACFAAAAKGYCNTHAVPELLQRVAQVVSQGGLWIGESLMQRLLQGTARIPLPPPAEAPADWTALLTERERQVATAVAGGASNKEIARQLGITERTVKAHAGAIFSKLDVRDRLQLSLLVHGRQAQ
jgi:two-component system, NarL family, nitrate/nitrite response regulator NarL